MLAAFAANDPPLDANGLTGRNWALVINLHLSRHCSQAACADCLAHRLVQQRSNDAAVQITHWAFEVVRNCRK